MSNPELVPELLEAIRDQLVSLNDKTDANTQQLVSLNERVDANTQQLVSLNDKTDANTLQLVSLNERVDGLNERVGGLCERVDGLNERVDGLCERVDQLHADHQRLYAFALESRQMLNAAAMKFENRVIRFENQLKGMQQAVTLAANDDALKERLDDHDKRLAALERDRASRIP